MIREIGKPLELAREALITIRIGGEPYRMVCTPEHVEELVTGFMITEGLAKALDDFKIVAHDSEVIVEVKINPQSLELRSSGCVGIYRDQEDLPRVVAEEKFSLEDARRALGLLEIEEYRKTRGYHVAAVVSKSGFVRRYDVGRHNAVDKAVGAAILSGFELSRSFLVLSGRISRGIVAKCARAGIPLIVSKAAILDSAVEVCRKSGIAAVSFATNIAVTGNALII